MNCDTLRKQFDCIGARVKIGPWSAQASAVRSRIERLMVDVRRDQHGEFFDIRIDTVLVHLEVVSVQPRQRQLMALARHFGVDGAERFICGCDERGCFVAALPQGCRVTNVAAAVKPRPPQARPRPRRSRVRLRQRRRARTPSGSSQDTEVLLPGRELEPALT